MRFRFHRATNRGTPDFFPFGFERGVLFDGISPLSLPVFLFILHKRQVLYQEIGQYPRLYVFNSSTYYCTAGLQASY